MDLSNLTGWTEGKVASACGAACGAGDKSCFLIPVPGGAACREHPIDIAAGENSMKQYFAFQWHIADACDQRCKHCYIFSEDCGKAPDAMTWPQIEDTFYNCLDFCEMHDRLLYFYLTGDDPILHPDF